MRREIIEKARAHALRFRREFKKQTITAITAAFGFLIALSWREPISDLVKLIAENLGLTESLIYYQFLSAVIVTIIGVFVLLLISRWASEN